MVFACSIAESSPAPDWVLGRGHSLYDPSQYLMGVGHSEKSSTSASESARAELIKSISIKISSTVRDYVSTDKSFAESSTHTSTDFLLEGSQVKDGWFDDEKDIYYSLVVIKRQYVLDTLLNIIDLTFQKNLLTLKQGDSFYSDKDYLTALVYYYDGYVDSLKLFPYIQTYNSVILNNNNQMLDKKHVINLIFKDKISKIVENISIKSASKTIKNDKVEFGVGVYLKDVPISKFPVKFYSVHKHMIERVSCGSGGCGLVVDVPDVVSRTGEVYIKASIDVKTLSKYFSYKLSSDFFKRLELMTLNYKIQLKKSVPDNPFVVGDRPWTSERNARKHRAFNQLHNEVTARGLRGNVWVGGDIDTARNQNARWRARWYGRIGIHIPMDIK